MVARAVILNGDSASTYLLGPLCSVLCSYPPHGLDVDVSLDARNPFPTSTETDSSQMPATVPSDKVLVTGANGYIGVWVTKLLLERGYQVRAAVRTKEKGEALVKIFDETLPERAKNLGYAVVADLTAASVSFHRRSLSMINTLCFQEHAYDDAVNGVSGVVHIASPLTSAATDPDLVIKPAVEGTLGLLKSVLAHGCVSPIHPGVFKPSCGPVR